jgi:hypothetical protein
MDNFIGSQLKRPHRAQRVNYLALNDGIDEEVPLEDRIIETPSKKARSSVEPIAPDDSASQLTPARSPLSVAYQQNEQTDDCLPDAVSISPEPGLSARRRPQNQSLWAQFDSFPLPGRTWHPKRGKGPIEDREIRCKRCNWKTTDSARATSTSNMMFHLSKHGIFSAGSDSSLDEGRNSIQQPSITGFF